jgi:alpha-D-xyloside xylohydrolase
MLSNFPQITYDGILSQNSRRRAARLESGTLLTTVDMWQGCWFALSLLATTLADVNVTVSGTKPFQLTVSSAGITLINSAILSGILNTSTSAISASNDGVVAKSGGVVDWSIIQPNVVKIQFNSTEPFTGAQFAASSGEQFYGVWEYPWNNSLTNNGVSFDLKGVGNSVGANWVNARAPAFYSSAGYGVYADTLDMGSFNFMPGQAQFIFNTSSLVYYIILPDSLDGLNLKSVIETYTGLSARITMPPDSGYGPTFWSDNFETDFHGTVSNAQENYYDVINHLYFNQIRGE